MAAIQSQRNWSYGRRSACDGDYDEIIGGQWSGRETRIQLNYGYPYQD